MSVPRPAMLVAIVTAPGLAGLGDDGRFALVLLRVQHLVRRRLRALSMFAKPLGCLDRGRADQHRSALLALLFDFLDDRAELAASRS